MSKNIYKAFYLFFYFFSLTSIDVFSQKNINGFVYSSTDSEPLFGVTILVKGKDRGTVTSIDGSFSIELSDEDDILVASFIGFISKEVAVLNQSSISIFLDEFLFFTNA